MSLSRELFFRNKELTDQWNAVAHSDWFGQVLMHARSAFMESIDLKDGELSGAKRFESILRELADKDQESVGTPSSGLRHDLDTVHKKEKPKTESTPQ